MATPQAAGAQPQREAEAGVEDALARLTLDQKVRLLTGADFWRVHAVPEVGLRAMVLSDGPSGVRGPLWDEREPSLSLPSATALGASWDPALAYAYGAAAAAEARRKGVDVVLGPTINLHRSPLGGRHFEAYSEDPLLTGVLAAACVRGLQDHGVGACPKHYVANDSETDRKTVSVELSDRALRELYLAPFEHAVTGAGPWTVMSAYNAVGGVTMTEHDLLRSPLGEEWGFDGVVISDWTAVRSLDAARAAQDLVMPGPAGPWGDALVAAVRDGRIPEAVIDAKVRRILRLAVRVGALDAAGSAPPRPATPSVAADGAADGVAFARAAERAGIVLVRNQGQTLPLAAPRSVAVIGQSATVPRTRGGGSATVIPTRIVTPLDGLAEALPDTRITHAPGAIVHDGVQPFDLASMSDPVTGAPGLRTVFRDRDGHVLLDEPRRASDLVWLGNAPTSATELEVELDHTPTTDGPIVLGFRAAGPVVLELDGEVVLAAGDAAEGAEIETSFLTAPTHSTTVPVTAGRTYRIRARQQVGAWARRGVADLTVGWRPVVASPDALIDDAAAAARDAEVAVVVVGTTEHVESEGYDRTSLRLPGRQDDLVRAVAQANPRTIVVVNSGAPVLLPWREEVAAVLLTWFGGQEYGHALADVLTGAAEPGGRLPTTWPATQAGVPVIDVTPSNGVLRYDEGIHVGYRAWHKAGTAPAYPFGFGLGYTTWAYEAVRVEPTEDGGHQVSVDVRNTGDRPGREVVQVYLARPGSQVDRPARWLAGFAAATLDPARSGTVGIRLGERALRHWDERTAAWTVEPGTYDVIVGRHADSTELTTTLETPPRAVAT